jgi:hypothetical protein
MATTPAIPEQKQAPAEQTPAQAAFLECVENWYTALSRGRTPEEHEWFENGLFHQLRQWLERDPVTRRYRPRAAKDGESKPMPVTNHFSSAINRNANAMGADIPDMRAMADNYDAKNRRAAEAAERAIIQANRESGFEQLNPTLAQHVVLFGIGATKDMIDMSSGAESVESVQTQEVPVGLQCANCGYSEPLNGGQGHNTGGAAGAPPQAAGGSPPIPAENVQPGPTQAPAPNGANPGSQLPAAASPTSAPSGDGMLLNSGPAAPTLGTAPCPQCGGPMFPVTQQQEVPGEQTQLPVSRLKTKLLTPFEFYVPRDCGDPNLSPLVIEVSPMRVSEARAIYPDIADRIKPSGDKKGSNLALFYLQSLRRLMTAGSQPQEDETDMCLPFEAWCKWNWLPEDVQDAITAEWGDQPSGHPTYSAKGMTKLDAAMSFGVYGVFFDEVCAEMSEAPFEEKFPYTFYLFQKDIASPYPKGLGVEIKPLQKQINRIDSLMLKMAMTGMGKWIIPLSQSRTKPTGDPGDAIVYDDEAGKGRPEYVSGTPMMAALAAKRQQVVMDFDVLANTSSIDRGQAGATTGPFRALAFLGSKAEEARQTTRFLWEQAHEKRARLLLEMAKLAWDQPRKVKVSGFNNKFGMELLDIADLGDGNYSIEVVQDSSRPKTIDEKIQTVSMLVQGGFLNVQDPAVRDYIFSTLGMDDVDPANHVAYSKAERDLEMIKTGQSPIENPFINWQIEFMIFSIFIQTEEYEGLDPMVQAHVLMWAQYAQMNVQMAMAPPPQPGAQPHEDPNHKAGQALAGPSASQTLGGVAGKGFSPMQQQTAAQKEGQQVVDSLPQEQSTVQ